MQQIDSYLWTTFQEDEHEFSSEMEREWRENQQNHSFQQLIEMFPEAKPAAIRGLKSEIKKCQNDLDEADNAEREWKNTIQWKYKTSDQPFLEALLNVLYIEPLRKDKQRLINRNRAYLNSFDPKKSTTGVSAEQIEIARQVPIATFVKVTPNRKTVCLFHNDSNPSMHVYKNNTAYCFVCNKYADVIDIVMVQSGRTFVEVVKSLL